VKPVPVGQDTPFKPKLCDVRAVENGLELFSRSVAKPKVDFGIHSCSWDLNVDRMEVCLRCEVGPEVGGSVIELRQGKVGLVIRPFSLPKEMTPGSHVEIFAKLRKPYRVRIFCEVNFGVIVILPSEARREEKLVREYRSRTTRMVRWQENSFR